MPGKCDIWFQSHQIFHVLVLVAAFVHYHGISEMAMYRCVSEEPMLFVLFINSVNNVLAG